MTSEIGPDGSGNDPQQAIHVSSQSVELQLVESLVHHLIEKGVLTKNDALSVVQSVAEVKKGALELGSATAMAELGMLEKLYFSFESLTERPIKPQNVDGENLVQLRPPLHSDRPKFPRDN